jgi:membrane-associated phospholipid phosphatase
LKVHGLVVLVLLFSTAPLKAQTSPPTEEPPATGSDLSRFLPLEDPAEDGRRTLGAFPKNLGRSFIGVFSKDNLAPFLIGGAVTLTGTVFDQQAHDGLNGQFHSFSGVASTAGGMTVMAPLTAGLFVAGRFAHDTRFRAFTYDATQAVIVDGLYTTLLKKATHRERPDGSNSLSFPSGHASSAFALATVAEKHFGWKVGVPAYLAAGAVGFSRLSNNKHYLTDVLAGATLGVVVGRTVVHKNGEPVGRHKTFSLAPVTDAQGTGFGLGGSLSW